MEPVYKKVKMSLATGSNSVERKVTIPRGDRVYARAVAKPALDKIIDVEVEENGSDIHPPMDISHYDGGVGSFEQRGLQLPYQGGSEVTVRATTTQNLAAGESTEIEVVFMTWTNSAC